MEVCAWYFSMASLRFIPGVPFDDEARQLFGHIQRALPPGMLQFLDRLPLVLGAKPSPGPKRADRRHRVRIAQLLDAGLHHRKVQMRYHSFTSQRVKDYCVNPLRIVYAEGGLYLIGYVAEYDEVRTFAVERIQRLAIRDEVFTPPDHTVEISPRRSSAAALEAWDSVRLPLPAMLRGESEAAVTTV